MINLKTKKVSRLSGGILAVVIALSSLVIPAGAQDSSRTEIGIGALAVYGFSFWGNSFSTLPGAALRVDFLGKRGVGVEIEGVYIFGTVAPLVGVSALLCSPQPKIFRPYAFAGFLLIIPQAGAGFKLDLSKRLALDVRARYLIGLDVVLFTGGISAGW